MRPDKKNSEAVFGFLVSYGRENLGLRLSFNKIVYPASEGILMRHLVSVQAGIPRGEKIRLVDKFHPAVRFNVDFDATKDVQMRGLWMF